MLVDLAVPSRRGFLVASASLIASPALVRADVLMPIKELPYTRFVTSGIIPLEIEVLTRHLKNAPFGHSIPAGYRFLGHPLSDRIAFLTPVNSDLLASATFVAHKGSNGMVFESACKIEGLAAMSIPTAAEKVNRLAHEAALVREI